jgi:hypothetical protein
LKSSQSLQSTPHARDLGRREFLAGSAGAAALGMLGWPQSSAAQSPVAWDQGQLTHLIPVANHDRFLIKASFQAPLSDAPRLIVNAKPVAGVQTDRQGRFWRFDAQSLQPDTGYDLRITDAGGAPLCAAWPLRTFPGPDAAPERMRILAYTCEGGYDGPRLEGKTTYLDMAARRRLLARGMSFRPDSVITNGDHVYWDMETSLNKPFANYVKEVVWAKFGGALDLTVPMLHPKNASIFTSICDYQISGLYGVTLRSTPAFFLTDDHDMFENDEFDEQVAALPPDTYGTLGAEQIQRLYYPEFLPDRNRPEWLPGADKAGAPAGSNITFGTLRYGKLGDWYPDLLDEKAGIWCWTSQRRDGSKAGLHSTSGSSRRSLRRRGAHRSSSRGISTPPPLAGCCARTSSCLRGPLTW